jgi:hypothetical protein
MRRGEKRRPSTGATAPTLVEYQRHLELYGPEHLVETAARGDLTVIELGELKASVESIERVYKFKDGGWESRRTIPARACAGCGLDLPRNASSRMKRHPHCKSRASRGRQ